MREERKTLVSFEKTFHSQKDLADRALIQVSDENLRIALSTDTNSLAVIMKHMAGNMLSRWSDFLKSDGEKEWRNRDGEFLDEFSNREEVEAYWEKGWSCLFSTLSELNDGDLVREVFIRGEGHSVVQALSRQLSHYAYHVGQIVLIARMHVKEDWQVLTIARGKSLEFNAKLSYKPKV